MTLFHEYRGHDEAPRAVIVPPVRRAQRTMPRIDAELCQPEESRNLARSIALHMAVGAGVPAFIVFGIPMIARAIQWGGRLLGGIW